MSSRKVFWTEKATIRRWSDVIKLEKKFFPRRRVRNVHKRWIFRGEKADQYLKTKLQEKLEVNGIRAKKEKTDEERKLIRKFQRKSALYLEHEPDQDDVLEWLAVMRHRGAPTRLLDCTYSFYIAVYFALNENKKRTVWALDCSKINKPEPIVQKICGHVDGFRKFSQALLHYMRKSDFLGIQQEGDKLIDLAIATYLMEAEPPLPCVYPVNPFRLNRRLSVQQGLFLMPGDITKSFAQNLEATFKDFGGTEKHLQRVKIEPQTKGDRNEILRKLKNMNISNEALFPGLDGFARSVAESLAYPRPLGDREI